MGKEIEMEKCNEQYNEKDNLVYCEYLDGSKHWYEYDENCNLVHYKDSNSYESWVQYDENNNPIYFKNYSVMFGWFYNWYKWEDSKRIDITKQEFEKIEEQKFLSREPVERFELMEL
jgi:hypothetical protein